MYANEAKLIHKQGGILMKSIDVFAHVLPPKFFQKMLAIAPQIPDQAPFIKNRYLTEPNLRN